ncbi:LLM class flavin-dependent oxidoreductase [Nocardioides sp. CER19]|uniref:LLM class flavin-dependent oxidoreductase n=1 Tax=Nocardioides sp. CER19 TaxID=3038538 RepID=UPI00244BF396|nr:LLM class flavin-dependent oxidoreductase [Nocardioides sp. CER19]MDH2416292.1 LLM class flavin-dependent oxidoreductase [Nocardioides sp. CER19]
MSFRLAIHTDHREHGDQAEVYRDNLELFVLAERLGFESAWIRSYKFRTRGDAAHFPGGMPSPFVFLAALAARTSRLRLGTGVVPLPLENPVRVAEDAAVLDALSGGRFELGVSNGGQPDTAHALGVDLPADREEKKAEYLRRLTLLESALDGEPLHGTDQVLNPPAAGLSGRIWESALTELTGTESARRGHGVLIGTTQTVPAEVTAAAYHAALPVGAEPRVGIIFHLHVAHSREAALAALRPDVETTYRWGREWLPRAETLEEKAAAINVHYGTPEQIAESIAGFAPFPLATDLQVSVAYGTTDHRQRVEAVHAVVDDIAPGLGWRPTDVGEPLVAAAAPALEEGVVA